MKFGVISLDFRRFPLEDCFKKTKEYGFDGVEIWGGRPHAYISDMDAEGVKHILGLKKKYDLEVPIYTPDALWGPHRLTSVAKRERAEAMAFFKRSIEIAAEIEAPRMLLCADHPGFTANKREAWNCFVENVKELAAFAAPKGVTLIVEPLTPMESPVITTSDDAVNVLEDIGFPNVKTMLDVAPPTIANEPFSAYFTKLAGKTDYIHICNNDGVTDAHLRLSDGVIPIKDMFRVFKEWNYQGYVTIELYSEHYRDPELFLANAARIINESRAELGI